MRIQRYLFTAVSVLLVATSAMLSCKDDSDGRPWKLDAAAADASSDATLDTDSHTPDAVDAADTPDARDARDTRPPGPLPEDFNGCMTEVDYFPAERVQRATAPTSPTLSPLWREQFPVDDPVLDDLSDVTLLSEPSVMASRENGEPIVMVTGEGRLSGRDGFMYFGFRAKTGEMETYGGQSRDYETVLSTSPPPTLFGDSAIGMLAASHDTRLDRNDYFWTTSWSRTDISKSTFVGRRRGWAEPDPLETGRLLLMPGGMHFGVWGREHLVGFDEAVFDEGSDIQEPPRYKWNASAEYLWEGEADSPEIRHLAGAGLEEAAVLLENGNGVNQWVGVDRCGQTREIFTGGLMTREILWTGDAYLILVRANAVVDGLRPMLVRDGELIRQAGFGCRGLVEREPDEWACLRQTQTGFEVVTFGDDFEIRDTLSLPSPEPGFWSTAHLDLAGADGSLVVRGIAGQSDELAFGVAIVGPDSASSQATVIEAFSGDVDAAREGEPRIGVLTSDGIYAFSIGPSLYAVQTHISGLADTRHPRAIWAGNESRGYVVPGASDP